MNQQPQTLIPKHRPVTDVLKEGQSIYAGRDGMADE